MRRLFSLEAHAWRWLDAGWLLLLGIFVLAGMPIATFHGDEPMQIYMSHDYATAFIYREPQRLMTSPPYDIDTDSQLRILNGSVNRYAIGLSWHLAGMTNGDLPPRPGWDWGLDYQTNVDTQHRPSEKLLLAGRLSSALFLAFSAAVMFGLGWQFGGRPMAYLLSTLYTLNPVVLLNGRRAMMEGSLLFFGLLTILAAVIISRRRERGGQFGLWWGVLILAGGLALASKHTAVVFVASALGWIFVSELVQQRGLRLARTAARLALRGVLIAALFIAVSPALWNDPAARLQDLIAARQTLLDIQVTAHTTGAMTLPQRAAMIVTQPFLTPPAHFEVAAWATYEPITTEIERYMGSPLSGLQFGWLGIPLTFLAAVGLLALVVPRWRSAQVSWGQALGLWLWLLITIAMLMTNPLPWQRYYLPLIPLASLLACLGFAALMTPVWQQDKNPLVARTVQPHTG